MEARGLRHAAVMRVMKASISLSSLSKLRDSSSVVFCTDPADWPVVSTACCTSLISRDTATVPVAARR